MEARLRMKSVHFLHELARTLKLNILIIATAAVYFHRFYQVMTFQQYHRLHIVAVCLFIAAKVEESPRKIKDIIIAYFKCTKEEKEPWKMLEEFLVLERVIMQTLSFELQLVHPYVSGSAYFRELKGQIPKESLSDLRQAMCNFMNDSYFCDMCLRFSSQEISKAAFLLATVKISLSPKSSTWVKLLSISPNDEKNINDACHEILEVYSTLNILKEEETAALSPPSVTSPQASLFTSLHLKSQIERSSDIESKARTNGPRAFPDGDQAPLTKKSRFR